MEKYELGYSLCQSIIDLNTHKENIILRSFSLLANTFFRSYSYKVNNVGNNYGKKPLFFLYHGDNWRKDYLKMMNNVRWLFSNRLELEGKANTKIFDRKITIFNLKNLILIPYWVNQLNILGIDYEAKIRLAFDICQLKNFNDYLTSLIKIENYNSLFVLSDSVCHQNILVQFFRINHVPTATLQHGHYIASKHNRQDQLAINIGFEGFVSDKFFAWGEYTKNEAIKNGIDSDRVRCVGHPKYINFTQSKTYGYKGVFGVVLEGGYKKALSANIEMIKIANEVAKKKISGLLLSLILFRISQNLKNT
jgi:hypothetical protein